MLAAAPTTPPCFRRWRRSSSLLAIFSGNNIYIFAFGATAFAERSAAMKAPVGLLSGRAVCVSRWRGFAPTSSAERSKRYFHQWGLKANSSCRACFLRKHPHGGRVLAPRWGAVAQRLRGYKSAEPEKTVKRSSRRTGVNLQFFPVQPSSLGLKGASSPFFVAPARRNRWHFSGSLLVSKENIPRQSPLSPLFHMEQFTSLRRRWGCARCTRCSRPSLPGGRWRAHRCRSSDGWRGRWC